MKDASSIPGNDHVLEHLDDYRRSALPAATHAQVEAHLQQCEACSAELAAREILRQHLLASLPAATLPRQLPTAVRTTIRQTRSATMTQRRRGSNLLPWMLAAAVVAVSAVALVQIRPPEDFADAEVATVMQSREDTTALAKDKKAAAESSETDTLRKGRAGAAAPARSLSLYQAEAPLAAQHDSAQLDAGLLPPPAMMPPPAAAETFAEPAVAPMAGALSSEQEMPATEGQPQTLHYDMAESRQRRSADTAGRPASAAVADQAVTLMREEGHGYSAPAATSSRAPAEVASKAQSFADKAESSQAGGFLGADQKSEAKRTTGWTTSTLHTTATLTTATAHQSTATATTPVQAVTPAP